MNKKKLTFVIGPYRSGTSMVSRVLMELDIDPGPADDLYPATEWNPAGYIQRPDVTLFNTYLIEKSGGSLFSPGIPSEIVNCVSRLDFEKINLGWALERNNILIKDPRFCFTLMAWIAKGPFEDFECKIIKVARNLDDNVRSAMSHYDVRNYCGPTNDTAAYVLSSYNYAADWQCRESGLDYFFVNYEDILSNPVEIVSQLAHFVGCSDQNRIIGAVKSLRSGKSLIN